MKTTFQLILTTMVFGMVLNSCINDLTADAPIQAQDGMRVISVSFGPDTKVTLDGLQPKFTGGEYLAVSNGSAVDTDCQVEVDGKGNAWFTTDLQGELKVVYPWSAAAIDGNQITGVQVEAEQNGILSDAIIAMATVASDAKKATFENQTALFKITPPKGVTSFTITSLKPIGDAWRAENPVAINTGGADGKAQSTITVNGGSTPLGTYYVSLLPGVKLSDLSFDAGETYGMKGIPENAITATTNATLAGTMYTVTNEGWHPYVIVSGRKWATMNIGAEKPSDCGTYFAWGDVKGQKPSDNGSFATPFNWANAPFNGGDSVYNPTKFLEVRDTECPSAKLALKNDAAYVNWGGPWRIPTDQDFASSFLDSSCPSSLTFPLSGYVVGEELKGKGTMAFYGSCLVDYEMPKEECYLIVGEDYFLTGMDDRYYGVPVRPVAD